MFDPEVRLDLRRHEQQLVVEGGEAELPLAIVGQLADVDALVQAAGDIVDDGGLAGAGDALDVGNDLPVVQLAHIVEQAADEDVEPALDVFREVLRGQDTVERGSGNVAPGLTGGPHMLQRQRVFEVLGTAEVVRDVHGAPIGSEPVEGGHVDAVLKAEARAVFSKARELVLLAVRQVVDGVGGVVRLFGQPFPLLEVQLLPAAAVHELPELAHLGPGVRVVAAVGQAGLVYGPHVSPVAVHLRLAGQV